MKEMRGTLSHEKQVRKRAYCRQKSPAKELPEPSKKSPTKERPEPAKRALRKSAINRARRLVKLK